MSLSKQDQDYINLVAQTTATKIAKELKKEWTKDVKRDLRLEFYTTLTCFLLYILNRLGAFDKILS